MPTWQSVISISWHIVCHNCFLMFQMYCESENGWRRIWRLQLVRNARSESERIENIAALNELYVLRAIAFVRATENKFAKSNQTPKETRNGIY